MKALRAGAMTWMLARIDSIDQHGPPPNQELFRWLDGYRLGGYRACEYKVHHPHACRAYAFRTNRGFVIVRIEDKTENAQQISETMRTVKTAFTQFLEEGEKYE